MNNKELAIKALKNFRKAYYELLVICDTEEGENIINSDVSIDNYPFDRSFNELNIIEWVDSITEATNWVLSNENIKII